MCYINSSSSIIIIFVIVINLQLTSPATARKATDPIEWANLAQTRYEAYTEDNFYVENVWSHSYI